MSLHRLTKVVVAVPDPAGTAGFYEEFGLRTEGGGRFSTVDGGEQLELVAGPTRGLVELGIGCDDPDDLGGIDRRLRLAGIPFTHDGATIVAIDPGSGVRARITVAPRYRQHATPAPPANAPGVDARRNARAPGGVRTVPVRPRRLGHVVVGSTDVEASERLFVTALGFRVSDVVQHVGSFLRCSTDHHNLMVTASRVPFLHHTSWQVDDLDDVGRGAASMIAADPTRHVWGLGRHNIGGNLFWYLRDPAGNFAEYYSDLDVITDDERWVADTWRGRRSLAAWAPPAPLSFLAPDDIAELIAAQRLAHRTPPGR